MLILQSDFLGAMKTKDDHSLPTLKVDLLTLYIKWKGENRVYISFNVLAHALAMEAENNVVIERNVELDSDKEEDNDDDDVVVTENV